MGLNWYRDLYVGELARSGARRTRRAVDAGKYPLGVYLVTVPQTIGNQLELYPARELTHAFFRENCRIVAGIALGRREALRLVRRIAEDAAADGMGDRPGDWILKRS